MGKKELETACIELGLTIEAFFVPYSQSENAKMSAGSDRPWRSLNWTIVLRCKGSEILRTNFAAGVGHTPTWASGTWASGASSRADVAAAIAREIETGRANGKPILPDRIDCIASVVADADVLDFPDFEAFAGELGYNPDSRHAERIYNACVKTAIALRAAVGEDGLAKLRAAREDY
jgi:hypothetical protein